MAAGSGLTARMSQWEQGQPMSQKCQSTDAVQNAVKKREHCVEMKSRPKSDVQRWSVTAVRADKERG